MKKIKIHEFIIYKDTNNIISAKVHHVIILNNCISYDMVNISQLYRIN